MDRVFTVAVAADSAQGTFVLVLDAVSVTQGTHRRALAGAAGRLRELEVRRVTAIKDVVATFLTSYPYAITKLLLVLMPVRLGDAAVLAGTLNIPSSFKPLFEWVFTHVDELIRSAICWSGLN